MKGTDFLFISLMFGIVALLCLLMVNNPLFMGIYTDEFQAGHYGHGPLNDIFIRYSTISILIFIPSAYLAIAFAIIGFLKVKFGKKKRGELRKFRSSQH